MNDDGVASDYASVGCGDSDDNDDDSEDDDNDDCDGHNDHDDHYGFAGSGHRAVPW